MSNPSKIKRYVYNGSEVQLTGRVAEKELRRGVDTLYEIKPFDSENGSWHKWVRLTDLYEIKISKMDNQKETTNE